MDDDEVVIKAALKKQRALVGSKPENCARYIGLSRNGKKWQVLVMIDKKWTYITSLANQEACAWVYDKMIIYLNGMSAKTNFTYTKWEVESIVEEMDDAMRHY